jgi:hypothetical protein
LEGLGYHFSQKLANTSTYIYGFTISSFHKYRFPSLFIFRFQQSSWSSLTFCLQRVLGNWLNYSSLRHTFVAIVSAGTLATAQCKQKQ